MRAKKIFSAFFLLFLSFTLLPTTANAATTGTLYKNFTEITDKTKLVDTHTYIFLKKHYASTDAVTTLSGGNATLTMTATSNGGGGHLTGNGYTVDKFVAVSGRGAGFDTCLQGAICYASVNFNGMDGTPGTGWYYWCDGGGVLGVGPFYAYNYDTVPFSDTDVDVTVDLTGVTNTVTNDKLTVKVMGYTVTDYTITDGSISPTDMTIGLDVGGVNITKTVGSVITYTSHTGNTTTASKLPGTPIYVPNSDGTNVGFTFKGWSLTSGSTNVNYLPGSEFNMDANTTLYAVWGPIVYHSVSINGVPQSVESGTTVTQPASPSKATEYFDNTGSIVASADDATAGVVKKVDYTFAGWKNQASGQLWDFSTPVSGPLTLVPAYNQVVSYKIMCNKNNANSLYATADQWIVSGNHVSEVTAPVSVTSGATTYYFAGWNTKQNGSGEFWNFYGDVVSTNLTLYAQWTTVDAYNIEFNNNLSAPHSDYVWHTGSLNQDTIAATSYVLAPSMQRVDYVFDGWYTNPSCNASNSYNLNRTLNDNNAAGIDTDNDKCITLYAKWTVKYTSENDVLISDSTLPSGNFAEFYSNYLNAFENNASYNTPLATHVYRNFYLVNANGTLVNPSSLPEGLHLNSRNGEIYGVPSKAGDYTCYVRVANDEGKWISLPYPISISIAKPTLTIDMKNDDTGLEKMYGSNDPVFCSEDLTVSSGTASTALSGVSPTVSLLYDFSSAKTLHTSNYATFNPALATTLKFSPDRKDATGDFIPANKAVPFTITLRRTSGEDTGNYKLNLSDSNISSPDQANYSFSISSNLSNSALSYNTSGALTTPPEYVFSITPKTGLSYTNTGVSVEYGTYTSGSDVKTSLTTGPGLVNNSGIQVADAFQSIKLSSANTSTSGKLKAGTYSTGFTSVITNTASPKGTSQNSNATTTANYNTPNFSLTINAKSLTVNAKSYSVLSNSTCTVDNLRNLISLNSVAGDDVNLTITAVKIGSSTFDLLNPTQKDDANKALKVLVAVDGNYPISINYSNVLTGNDATNYSIVAGTLQNAPFVVYTPAAVGGGGGGGGGGSAPSPASGVDILVNGKVENAGSAKTSVESGTSTTTVVVDADKLEKKLSQEGTNAIVTIPVKQDSDVVVGELTGQMVHQMAASEASLVLKTVDASYTLPAKQIDLSSIAEQLSAEGKLNEIKVHVEIAEASSETRKALENAAKVDDASIVVPPMEFRVTCTYGTKTVEVKSFSAYVERTIAIPEGVDPNKITTGVILDPDNTIRHVPTKITVINGKYYAVINSLSNSIYSVVWHPIEFQDVSHHWAKTAVNNMGSRMVISGVGNSTFEPDRDITRAEFAAIMVRALGLKPGLGSNSFRDVKASEWYSGYISTAAEYKLITGYDSQTFGPMDKITREQAMTMIARSMDTTGLKTAISKEDTEKLLSTFKDAKDTASYAQQNIVKCIHAGLVSGRSEGLIAPKENITRAEVAQITDKLLQKSQLINH